MRRTMKKTIRKNISQLRDQLTLTERQVFNQQINQHLVKHLSSHLESLTYVTSFVAFRSEVDLSDVNKVLSTLGKLLLPRVEGTEMIFYKVEDLSCLIKSPLGILEPPPENKISLPDNQHVAVLTPSVAYDKKGYRIGYGGGFYDRFFATHQHVRKIGVCYEQQVISSIPIDAHDIAVDYIITERGIHHERL